MASGGREGLGVRVRAPLAAAASVLGLAVALRLRDPHEPGSWGFCPTSAVIGLDCPLCGGLRAVNDLARGDALAAVGSNALVVLVVLPVLVAVWLRWLERSVRSPGRVRLEGPQGMGPVLMLGLAVGFAVLRNLPGLEGLSA